MAVFMTSLDILDTGFLAVGRETPSDRVNQLGTSSRVNSGSVLRLKGVEVSFTSSSNIDKGAVPGKTNSSATRGVQCALVSSNPTEVTIRLKLNQKNTDTDNEFELNDMSYLAELIQLPHTKGFKAIYYPVDNTATGDTRNLTQQVIYRLGATDTTQTQGDIDITIWDGSASASTKDLTDVNYVAMRFESCEIKQSPNNMIDVTLTGVITE